MLDRDGGIDVDTIGDMSQVISHALDEHDPVPDSRYLLEVTSPGIERRLRLPGHFQAQIGKEVNLKVRQNVEGDRRFEARIDAATKKGIDVTVESPQGPQSRHLSYEEIESARLVFRWASEEKPNTAKSKTKKSPVSKNKSTNPTDPITLVSEPATPNKKASER
jgi:ribosome maturation factor RimP